MDEVVKEKAETSVKKDPSESEMKAFERQTEVRLREKRLREFLSPFESFIMSVQSLLVWEKPVRSAVMVLCVNGLFWMAVATNYRVIFVAAVSGIIFVSMETICTRVWPEIRVQKPDEDEEGWTPVHPHLLSLPELCEHIAKLWVTMERLNTKLWGLRQDYPSKFCLYMCGLCLTLAAIGHQISGALISYIMVTGLLLWPALEYHNISGRLYQRIEPILQQLDHSIDSPRREKKLRSQQRMSRARANPTDDIDSSSDSDLDEFCPSPGPSVDAALAHAAAAGRYTPRSSGLFSGLSKGMSLDLNTDDEFTDTEPPSYMGGLSQVPSFDNTAYDLSADELEIDLPYDNEPPAPSKSSEEEEIITPESSDAIKFDPSHFRESSEIDNEELLVGDLEFPDVEGSSSGQSLEADKLSPVSLPPAAAMLLSHTVKSLMTDALSKLQEFGSQDDISSASEPSQISQQQQRQPPSHASGTDSAKRPKLVTMDSDIAEFEMLDREELETSEEGKVSGEEKKDKGKTRSKSGYGIGFLTSWLSGKRNKDPQLIFYINLSST